MAGGQGVRVGVSATYGTVPYVARTRAPTPGLVDYNPTTRNYNPTTRDYNPTTRDYIAVPARGRHTILDVAK
ncbi:hypothetical protein [Salinibacterium sp.]|uniref:hypothetical protein n=1 Tax=Salinibacterium sp. TaxID=1915057 RepID=UPI00286C7CF1|nr:hypothetical protein [Salinibacterium sp.]